MDTPINPDIVLELEIERKKHALARLEWAINTYVDEACRLKLSDDGKTVAIQFIGGGNKTANINGDSGIAMLYDVLKQGFME